MSGQARCSPATFDHYNTLKKNNAAAAAKYKQIAEKNCSFSSTDLKGYVGIDGKTLHPFSSTYTDPNYNTTGTCHADLKPISATDWNNLTQGMKMTKDDFCNLATVDITNKTELHNLGKKIKATMQNIVTEIENMEAENKIYFNNHNTYNSTLSNKIGLYSSLYSQFVNLLLAAQPSQHAYWKPWGQSSLSNNIDNKRARNPTQYSTLEGQREDVILRRRASYYQFIVWGILAIVSFTYTMSHLRR